MSRHREEIRHIGALACTQLFESYGVSLARESGQVTPGFEMGDCGVVHFKGEGIQGTIGLASPQDILGNSDPAKVGARDWVGELANQLVGRIKRRLLAHRVEISYSTPVVLRGDHLSLKPTRSIDPLWFRSEVGSQVCLLIDLDLADRFEMADQPDEQLAGLPEGDFLLF